MRLPTKAKAPRISAAKIATNTTYVEALAAEAFAGRRIKVRSLDLLLKFSLDRHVPHLSSLLDVVPLPMLAPARRPHSSPWFKASARLRGIPSPAQRLVGEADTISAAFAPLLHFIQALVAAADVIECLALHFRSFTTHVNALETPMVQFGGPETTPRQPACGFDHMSDTWQMPS
eukprot:CAMPEP_0177231752 /NCGR_PEP_ID=MMETSP0367-20130122/42932_1 /TAXON_ID=447022 ORGANISM="Scrippsiella hangoei-like, Strain SHHI-4" /NCGR_SAMPLE_ID=MMETSP0367 /ASSEMBLY_ACC=CAM_ASM_000362 /LENGTH=174 /DNA_ID=CAMNT_0018682303 /DNA_START=55 /DNA_END=578 /DNA_ORIENTATION=+